MVRAILDQTKTQTRRLILPEPDRIKRIARVQRAMRDGEFIRCKFGAPGDRLWVRERWAMDGQQVVFVADTACGLKAAGALPQAANGLQRWRPSYMMPRPACRIVLEITSLRIEHLANITRTDARAEGFPRDGASDDPIAWFRDLWDGLCKPEHAWSKNPWVWVIGFHRLETEE